MTLPVNGRMADGSEVFTGTATGNADGGGTLAINSNEGRSCVGSFAYVTGRNGEGVFMCNDGQSSPLNLSSQERAKPKPIKLVERVSLLRSADKVIDDYS